jgi:hypothetical protein
MIDGISRTLKIFKTDPFAGQFSFVIRHNLVPKSPMPVLKTEDENAESAYTCRWVNLHRNEAGGLGVTRFGLHALGDV